MAGTDFGDEREEIIADFIVETEELTERLDQELVRLEETPGDLNLLNSIFRSAHTIKGTSSFLGFTRMTELTHKAENVLDKLRNQAFSVTSEIMDCLLQALDGIRALLEEIRVGRGVDGDFDPQPIMARLIAIVEGGGKAGATSAVTPGVPSDRKTRNVTKSVASDLDALLASAPVVEPKFDLPATPPAAKESMSLDDILASAPAINPTVEIPAAPVVSKETPDVAGKRPTAPLPPGQAAAAGASAAGTGKQASGGDGAHGKSVNVEQTIRVDVERLDALMNLAGELVLGRNRLANITRQLESSGIEHEGVDELSHVVASISLVAGNLQTAVMKARMLPIGKVFNRFPRMIRDLARDKKKLVELNIVGGDTEVDKSVIEAIGDPLVHLVRNAVDHGIESPETRRERGKAETGRVELSAEHQGNSVVITITDDGNGMDSGVIKAIALKRGVLDENQLARISDKEIRMLIFMPGFSTATVITDTSGRGVGMDVVKTNIESLGGMIDIESTVGQGSVISIKLPLTLAIIQALMVKAGGETYAISLANVLETVRVSRKKIQTVEGHEVIRLRDRVLPVVQLAHVLDCAAGGEDETEPMAREYRYVVVLGLGEQHVGLIVDRLLGQEEVVIKSLGDYLQSVPGIAGSTILGDGRVALIIDVAGLMTLIQRGRFHVAGAAK